MPAHGYRVGSLLAGLLSLLAGNAVARWPTDGANADTDRDRERERLPSLLVFPCPVKKESVTPSCELSAKREWDATLTFVAGYP